jgi:hypothetical protein
MNYSLNEVMKSLKANRNNLTRQQLRTLKGQALAGDTVGAMKGLQKILKQGK